MNELLIKLSEAGADIESAMERFIEDEELYVVCFDEFLKDEAFLGLSTAIKNKDYAAIVDYAHTLKGVSGNLGLKTMFNELSLLVQNLRNEQHEFIEKSFEQIDAELSKLKSFR